MIFLVDYNLDGYALLLLGILAKRGWLELISIRFVTFREVELSMDTSDRIIWHYAQANQMMILTANRNMKGEDSLEQVMREENTPISFPVITIGNLARMDEYDYREQCADRLVEIVLDIDNYLGVGRLFVP
ncbi:ACP S-malonyltransferase [Anabaena sp. UHCC 0451]|uniref:ACP S-malonyltransferase n=1 Tax=Anabaena sp. UHCC 0451 TaxID=2055235 RepID=UPI002B20DB55|nr:ACP S-malonyltransferase [Anabaena sp. UHCC 0451]MEA5578571.1 ACP S-malonyltransferase [Anabaena sp. UHCC 0451]